MENDDDEMQHNVENKLKWRNVNNIQRFSIFKVEYFSKPEKFETLEKHMIFSFFIQWNVQALKRKPAQNVINFSFMISISPPICATFYLRGRRRIVFSPSSSDV